MTQIDIYKALGASKTAYDARVIVSLLIVRGGWHGVRGWEIRACLDADDESLTIVLQGKIPSLSNTEDHLVTYTLPIGRAHEIDFTAKGAHLYYRFSKEDPYFVSHDSVDGANMCVYQDHDTIPESIQQLIRGVKPKQNW